MNIEPIATIHTPFPEKFGVPRQSGLSAVKGTIVFDPKYRNVDAVRGLEGYSYIWLIWQFSVNKAGEWSPTVRPPRLGGNKRMGVFATRSPFRPNNLGLSSVRLTSIDLSCKDAPVLHVEGADLVDGTPIYDIKPYLTFTDCHTDASCGFAGEAEGYHLKVVADDRLMSMVPPMERNALINLLSNDPRPSYHDDPERIYKMSFLDLTVEFFAENGTLTVTNIYRKEESL